jgi:hypothetical protein
MVPGVIRNDEARGRKAGVDDRRASKRRRVDVDSAKRPFAGSLFVNTWTIFDRSRSIIERVL